MKLSNEQKDELRRIATDIKKQGSKLEQARQELRGSDQALIQTLREARGQMAQRGIYTVLPTEALIFKVGEYFKKYETEIKDLLRLSEIDTQTIEAILEDYNNVLSGLPVGLALDKQKQVVEAVAPNRLYQTDRYGLLYVLFNHYKSNIYAAQDYTQNFKNIPADDIDRKSAYLKNVIDTVTASVLYAEGFYWIWRNRSYAEGDELFSIVNIEDFAGIDTKLANTFFAHVGAAAMVDYYVCYYYIAKYALDATDKELEEIAPPPVYENDDTARKVAEAFCKKLNSIVEDNTNNAVLSLSEMYLMLLSRDVYFSAGEKIDKILPIAVRIKKYMEDNHLTEKVSPGIVTKVIEGIQLMLNDNTVRPEKTGIYMLETNISKFAERCGYKDANQTEKMQIVRALQILDDIFIVDWRPRGMKAVRLLTIQEIGISGEYAGRLKLQVRTNAIKGRPILISAKDFEEMRKHAKGLAATHFRNIILSRGNKEEEALLDEVFGYTASLDAIRANIETNKATVEDLKKEKRNISAHKSRDKQTVAKWFEEYKQKGWIVSYSYTKNKNGKYIYKWRRGNIPPETSTFPTVKQEPDEQ